MFLKFLIRDRARILVLTRKRILDISESRPTSAVSERGLPRFYDYLICELTRVAAGKTRRLKRERDASETARLHGRELSRLGYSVSQVVLGYGALCQAITEFAQTKDITISASEFKTFNLSLDEAIADAVMGFSAHASALSLKSAKRMDGLVRALRGAAKAALKAHSVAKKDCRGDAADLLAISLNRMLEIIDRSSDEMRECVSARLQVNSKSR